MSAGEVGRALFGCPGAAADICTTLAHTLLSPASSGSPAQLTLPAPFSKSLSPNKQSEACHTSRLAFAVPAARNASAQRLLSHFYSSSHDICKMPLLSKPLTEKTHLACIPTAPCHASAVLPLHCSEYKTALSLHTHPPCLPVISRSARDKPAVLPTPPNFLALPTLGCASQQMLLECWLGEQVNMSR